MRKFEITYFTSGDATSGIPEIFSTHARDHEEAKTEFYYLFPSRTVFSVDEVDPDYDLETLYLE